MRTHSLPYLAAVFALSTSMAGAADLPSKAPAHVSPAPPPFSWTGFYIGIHGGAGWGTTESTINGITITGIGPLAAGLDLPLSSHGTNGWLFGGQIGYNWQVNPWLVLGIEGEGAWNNLEGTTPCLVVLACKTEVNWTADIAGRVGFAVDRALIYVKGGVVWANSDYSASLNLAGLGIPFSASTSTSDTRVGGLFGVGVEYAFLPNWTAKIEYNFMDFGDNNQTFNITIPAIPATVSVDTSISQQIHVVKAGVNYKFW